MRSFKRAVAALLTIGIAVGATLPASAMNLYRPPFTARSGDSAFAPIPGRFKVAGARHSIFPSRDLGRQPGSSIVRATILLRYNHQAELEKLAALQGDRRSPIYHHFLSNAQFNNYFAPTVQQQASVVAALQAGGLRVTHAFSDRTLLDVVGSSANVERFFGTEMHAILQGRYGVRFANVRPATLPNSLAALVKSVSLSNLIIARTGPRLRSRIAPPFAQQFWSVASQRAALANSNQPIADRFIVPPHREEPAASPEVSNVVVDPGFESGAFGHGWERCDTAHATPLATFSKARVHTGKYSGRAGSTSSTTGEQSGYAGLCQPVRMPANGVLTAYLYQLSNESNTKYAAQDVFLLDEKGEVAAILAQSVANRNAWVQYKWNVGAYAGRELYLYFGVHGNGNRRAYTVQYVDDVSLIGAKPTPTPKPTATPTQAPTTAPTQAPTVTPTRAPTVPPTQAPTVTPTQAPTTTPTQAPTATPTQAPTPTPTQAPTSTPTQVPTASPTQVPTAAPTTTPTPPPPSMTCTNAAPDSGPLTTNLSYGFYLATGVADAFDFPVQHGCNGLGQAVAIEISAPVEQSDVTFYLQEAQVTQIGTLTNVAVDNGGTYDGTADGSIAFDASIEAALDSQTIFGLAPGVNVFVYNFPDLSDGSIEDGYIQTVSDDKVSVTNSSFGGCEDPEFAATTNLIAVQGSVKGITFVASSGDSGSDGCADGNSPPEPESPASGPYFVSVGGDNLTEDVNGNLTSLTAVGDSYYNFYSGGGTSGVFPQPNYQIGVPNVAPYYRNVPDVSLAGVGVTLTLGSQYYTADGTSWSSPQMVALIAETNELQGATGSGFLNPRIYALYSNYGLADFTDVTVGDNGTYSALPGYDEVTGLGAPKGEAFAKQL